jgi:hypothetical protein
MNPCPFCGSVRTHTETDWSTYLSGQWDAWITCQKCGIQGPRRTGLDEKTAIQNATVAWNARCAAMENKQENVQ